MLPSDILQTSTQVLVCKILFFCFFGFFCVFMFFVFSGLLRLLYFAFCTNSWRSSGFFYFCTFVLSAFYVFYIFIKRFFSVIMEEDSILSDFTCFLWVLKSKACRLPKNGTKACIPKCIFIWQKPADLNFEGPKPADQIFFKAKPVFLNKFLKVPVKPQVWQVTVRVPAQPHAIPPSSLVQPGRMGSCE